MGNIEAGRMAAAGGLDDENPEGSQAEHELLVESQRCDDATAATIPEPIRINSLASIEVLENFAMVAPGIYRSSFPKKKHYDFMRRIKIKTILFLAMEEYPDSHQEWMGMHGLQLKQHGVSGNKEPFVEIEPATICQALTDLLDVRNHPVLIHCNKGKHRTGCL